MENIREVVAKNISTLRKQAGMTQLDLAKKINYSDKAISRWEKCEVIPDVETLNNLSKIFDVPLSYLLEEHTDSETKYHPQRNEIIFYALMVCVVWIFTTVLFVYLNIIYEYNFWQAFVWGVPLTCCILLFANRKWNYAVIKMVCSSVFIWSIITCFYLQFMEQNLWLIYLIGIPIQAAIIVSFFMKPNKKDF